MSYVPCCRQPHGTRRSRLFLRYAVLVAVAGWCAAATVSAQSPASGLPEPPAAASSLPLRFGGETTFVTSYVWRGFIESDMPCIQPGGWVALGPVSLEGWMNLEAADGRLHNAEYDVSLLYTHEAGRVTLVGGLANYFFDTPEGGRERHSELALSLTGDTWLSPSIEAYYSLSAERGAHVTAGLSHPFRVATHAVLTAQAAVGYNHRMWIERSGLTDLRGTLKVTLEHPSAHLRFDIGIDYSHALMRSLFSNRLVGLIGISAD